MAVTGSWKAKQNGAPTQASALKWGTGVNIVHAHNDQTGRNIAPASIEGSVPSQLIDSPPNYNYSHEDSPGVIWGYSDDSGTQDRPRLGVATEDFRGSTDLYRNNPVTGEEWPAWGPHHNGIPGGTLIREHDHGAQVSKEAKVTPDETVTEGWRNKETGAVLDAHTSDPSQYEMQTSMTQRDKVRAGSQTSGRASTFSAPIRSRIVGMRLKLFSGGERHYDMMPRRQDPIVRPFWSRTAGTGHTEWLAANEQVAVTPVVRNPPADPNPGPDVPIMGDDPHSNYGYQAEDMIPYA